ncbi:pyridoxal phosphate synthase yaaE subunit [Seinonella peptonophila]|uniref:Pyridoxal 5'-phosphate synthase subunit PdxT n=1 Tax=Seinonella peptonophila TaxID=112248 RepID=A0A1M4W7C5_9BACL|nr:pyridoxal 5'-phosphate synthase glutaminase subunit PdxT [Seinonella peptonophila]SHE76872.1 pyridoxal phosphate synthase yaaE subunit [Seinonella peptonophila]
MKIGILALQGAVSEHLTMLNQLDVDPVLVKNESDLTGLNGLIIPGGESTTIARLMHLNQLMEPIKLRAKQGLPMMGTCAGLIILAQHIHEQSDVHLGILNVTVSRNAFGRQRDSFEQLITVKGLEEAFPAVFIRAPLVEDIGEDVEVLATVDHQIVAVKQGQLIGLSFHPELTSDVRFHQLFVENCRSVNKNI